MTEAYYVPVLPHDAWAQSTDWRELTCWRRCQTITASRLPGRNRMLTMYLSTTLSASEVARSICQPGLVLASSWTRITCVAMSSKAAGKCCQSSGPIMVSHEYRGAFCPPVAGPSPWLPTLVYESECRTGLEFGPTILI